MEEIILPSEMNYLALRIESFPTENNLKFLANKIARLEADSSIDSIEIQVWKSYFKPYTLEPSSNMFLTYELKSNSN